MAKDVVVIKFTVKFTWKDAIKLRVAGIWNVMKKNKGSKLLDVDIEDNTGLVTAPLPTEPRPRSKHPPEGYNASPFSDEPDPRQTDPEHIEGKTNYMELEKPSTPRPKPKHKYLTAESGDIIACQCPACQGKLKPANQSGNVFTLTVPNCPECSQPMEVEKIEAWDGFTCHQCDRHISLGDLTSENTPEEPSKDTNARTVEHPSRK